MNRVIRQALITLAALSLLLFIGMYGAESGDMGTTMLGVALYFPYVLLLTAYNELFKLFLARVGVKGLLYVLLPAVPILVWLALSGGMIKVRYWDLEVLEVLLILLLQCGLNAAFHFTTPVQRRHEETERG